MDQSLYFEGQNVKPTDVQNTEDTKQAQLLNRVIDWSTQQGITSGLSLTSLIGFEISVSAGTAYDSAGERVYVPAVVALPIVADDAGRYVLARHISVDDDDLEHPISGLPLATRRTDDYQIYISDTQDSGTVTLGKIDTVDGNGIALFDLTVRKEWNLRVPANSVASSKFDPDGSILTHVAARGTGVVSSVNPHGLALADIAFSPDLTPRIHQQLDHASGVEAPLASNIAKVTVNTGPTPDTVSLQQIGADSILVDGRRLEVGGLASTTILFTDGTVEAALYDIWVAAPLVGATTGVVGKTVRAQWVGVRRVLGVQPVMVATDHAVGSFHLVYTVSGTLKALRWADGPTQLLDATSKFYDLQNKNGKTIKVWVQVGDLPVGSATDTLTIETALNRTKLLLATLFWSGSATGHLGYGVEGTLGTSYDLRSFGNLATTQLSTTAIKLLQRMQYEMHQDGWVSGGEGHAVPRSFRFIVNSGFAYVNGSRMFIRSSELMLPASTVSVVFVDTDGTVRNSVTDPISRGQRSARVARVTTDGNGIIGWQDERTVLPKSDVSLLGAGSKFSVLAQQFARIVANQGLAGNSSGERRGRTRLLHSQGPAAVYHDLNVYLTQYTTSYTDPLTDLTHVKNFVGVEIAVNALWDPDNSDAGGDDVWIPVATTEDAIVYGFDSATFYCKYKSRDDYGGGAAYWYDTAEDGASSPRATTVHDWNNVPLEYELRRNRLQLHTLASNVSGANNGNGLQNPVSTTGFYNALTPSNFVKAWAVVAVTGSASEGLRLVAGFNIHGLFAYTSGFDVQLASDFDNYESTGVGGQSGAAASIVAGAPAGQARVTGLLTMGPDCVNHFLQIVGAASAANNGTFLIEQRISATEVYIRNPSAVTPDANNGAVSWNEFNSFPKAAVIVTNDKGLHDLRLSEGLTVGARMLNVGGRAVAHVLYDGNLADVVSDLVYVVVIGAQPG